MSMFLVGCGLALDGDPMPMYDMNLLQYGWETCRVRHGFQESLPGNLWYDPDIMGTAPWYSQPKYNTPFFGAGYFSFHNGAVCGGPRAGP